jgi:purine-nucleoside phosphorylase
MILEQTRKLNETVRHLKSHIKAAPRLALMTGTGLGDSAGFLSDAVSLPYTAISNFPVSTAPSHAGRIIFGNVNGYPLMAMQGRFHLYEGYSPAEVTYPIRVMQALGVKTVVITNAAGGLNPAFSSGDIMLIRDHLNLTGSNPLVGPNNDRWGSRFPDMSQAYDAGLTATALAAAEQSGIRLQQGVYAGLLGPSLETPAEIRHLLRIGADAVGLSTVHETIVAVHAGIRVLGLSIITNVHDPDHPVPAEVDEIIAVANRSAPELERLIRQIVERIDESEKS